jgi:hypothetical protein
VWLLNISYILKLKATLLEIHYKKVKVYLYSSSQTKMDHGYSAANVVLSWMYKPNLLATEPKVPAEQYQELVKKPPL